MKNERWHKIRHDLKGQIRRQGLILDHILTKCEQEEEKKGGLDEAIRDMDLAIEETRKLWEKFQALLKK